MGHAQSDLQLTYGGSVRHGKTVNRERKSTSTLLQVLSLGCAQNDSAFVPEDLPHEAIFLPSSKEKSSYEPRYHSTASLPLRVPIKSSLLAYEPQLLDLEDGAVRAYALFLQEFPEYRLTWILDTLRRSDFSRLGRHGETYVDYMGGSLYPESLVRVHTEFLSDNILGNTHTVSRSSKMSLKYADEARAMVLSFFDAPPSQYTVVFTQNASAALKLVGEAYPFAEETTYVLGSDSHNSVHGIREFARNAGAEVAYIPSTPTGGFDPAIGKSMLKKHLHKTKRALFAMTGQSNISNAKNSMDVLKYARSLGYHTLLDAAALAPTSKVSLADIEVDAMAISFYKMFGFPTGVGALVVRKDFLKTLQRPWFSGGTVEIVQVPGNIVTRSRHLHEQFEDGTISYLALPAVIDGLRFLSAYMPFLPLRLSALLGYLASSISNTRHEKAQTPVAQILSRLPERRPQSIGGQADTGSVLSLIFLSPNGEMIPNSFIEYAASKQGISLRTGCMCNPGGAAALLGLEDQMARLSAGATKQSFDDVVGSEIGVVRISLGLASNFKDAWNVVQFAKSLANDRMRKQMWDEWVAGSEVGQAL